MEQAELNRQLLQSDSKEVYVMSGEDQKSHRGCGQHHKINSRFKAASNNQGTGSRFTDGDKSKQRQVNVIQNCKRCGMTHKINECYAFCKYCLKCNKLNHFAKCCNARSVSNEKNNQVHNIDKSEIEIDKFVVLSLLEVNGNSWFEKVEINNSKISIKIDTGAEINLMPLLLCKKLKLEPIVCNVKIEAF